MAPAEPTIEEAKRFAREHHLVDADEALLHTLLVHAPRSPEHVLDLSWEGERMLVGSVLDTLRSASGAAVLVVLGLRDGAGSALVWDQAVDRAEALVRQGPRRVLEVPLPGPLVRMAPSLAVRGYSLAFTMLRMEREAPPVEEAMHGWRSAEVADAEALHALSGAAFAQVPGWYGVDVETFREGIAGAEIAPRLLFQEERLAGYARVGIEAGGRGMILTIGRDPSFRGQRLGERLLKEAMRVLQEAGATRLALEVAADNRPARELYRRHGFVMVDEEPTYRIAL